jgi:diguanylate cyclase (GGDEF)-like protein
MCPDVPKAEHSCRHEALGRALAHRAGDVAAEVVGTWARRLGGCDETSGEVEDIVASTSEIGTRAVGRYLSTGTGVTEAEAAQLADASRRSALCARSPTDMAKNYLTWRDATLRVLAEEAARLGVSEGILAAAGEIIHSSCDASLITMVTTFDQEVQAVAQRLADERTKLAHLALHDPLTGLANRSLLLDRLAQSVAVSWRQDARPAALFLDLDGFKAVNDSLGHKAGDRLLVRIADTLRALVRPTDTVARFGGDEFVILCEDVTGGETQLASLVDRVRGGVAASFTVGDELAVTVSVGAAIAEDDCDPEALLARADAAMYAAKQHPVTRRRSLVAVTETTIEDVDGVAS